MKDQAITFIDEEEARKWTYEPVNNFVLENLWIPKEPEFTKLGWFLFANT